MSAATFYPFTAAEDAAHTVVTHSPWKCACGCASSARHLSVVAQARIDLLVPPKPPAPAWAIALADEIFDATGDTLDANEIAFGATFDEPDGPSEQDLLTDFIIVNER